MYDKDSLADMMGDEERARERKRERQRQRQREKPTVWLKWL